MRTKYFLFGAASVFIIVAIAFFGIAWFYEKETQKAVDLELKKPNLGMNVSVSNISKSNISKINLKNLSDKKIMLESKNIIFVNLWATWCAPCVAELPEFEKLLQDEEIKKLSINFLFASSEDKEKVIKFAESKGLNLTFCSGDLIDGFATQLLPTTYIINKESGLVYKFEGVQKWNSELFKNFLKSLK